MKKHLLLILFALIFNALCAQDLIVTESQDSINCQILAIEDGKIHFNLSADRAKMMYLPVEDVQSFLFGFYPNTVADSKYTYKKKSDYARFRVAAAGGYSYRTPKVEGGLPSNYAYKLKNGYHYTVEFNYYFNRFIGIGMNYSASHFNPEMDTEVGNVLDKIRLQQIIPTFNVRILDTQKRGALVASIGLGYVDYRDKGYFTEQNNSHFATIRGATVGMLLSVGYDIPLSQTMALYVQVSNTGGVVTRFTMKDEITGKTWTESVDDIKNGEGLGKINLSLGLRFAK